MSSTQSVTDMARLPSRVVIFASASRDGLHSEVLSALAAAESEPTSFADWVRDWNRRQSRGAYRLALTAADSVELGRKLSLARNVLANGGDGSFLLRQGICLRPITAGAPLSGKVAFLFPGQGPQYHNMLHELATTYPVARETLDAGDEAFRAIAGRSLTATFTGGSPSAPPEQDESTIHTAVLLVNVALFRQLRALGLRPDVLLGQSAGEYAALAASEAWPLEIALEAMYRRTARVLDIPRETGGRMASVSCGWTELAPFIDAVRGPVTLASDNSPSAITISGDSDAFDALGAQCARAGVTVDPLPISHAYHSSLIAPAVAPLQADLSGFAFAPPAIPVLSSVDGLYYRPEATPAFVAHHLARQLTIPVEFTRHVRRLYDDGVRFFVECGPRWSLSGFVGDILGRERPYAVCAAIHPKVGEIEQFHRLLAAAFAWDRLEPEGLAAFGLVRETPGSSVMEQIPRSARNDKENAVLEQIPRSARNDKESAVLEQIPRSARNDEDVSTHHAIVVAPEPALPADAPPLAEVQQFLVEQLVEKTGYPPDLLEPDLDLEAELGIDTVKQVDVLVRAFRRYQAAPDKTLRVRQYNTIAKMAALVQARAGSAVGMDLAALREQAAAVMADNGRHAAPASGPPVHESPAPSPSFAVPSVAKPLHAARYVPHPVALPLQQTKPAYQFSGTHILVTVDPFGVARHVQHRLEHSGARVTLVYPHDTGWQVAADAHRVNLARPDQVQALVRQIESVSGSGIDGMFLLHALAPELPFSELATDDWHRLVNQSALCLLALLQPVYERFQTSPPGRAFVVAATHMGGCLGLSEAEAGQLHSPGCGAYAGFLKSLRRELPDVIAKVVDFDTLAPVEHIADRLVNEVQWADTHTEVGYLAGVRHCVSLSRRDRPVGLAPLPVDASWVFVVSGGGRGVVAAVVTQLAAQFNPTIYITGRTAPPSGSEPWVRMSDAEFAAYRTTFIIEERARDPHVALPDVQRRYDALKRARELHGNLRAFAAGGAKIHYRVCDVTSEPAVEALVADVRRRHGRIDAIVHGAMVEESRLVSNKTVALFRATFAAKFFGGWHLMRATLPDRPKLVMNFGSGASRFGNSGQTDYAAAGDLLAKATRLYHRELAPAARCVTIDWPAWLGTGWVASNPDLERLLRANGPGMFIEVDEGVAWFIGEMLYGGDADEIVLAGEAFIHAVMPAAHVRPEAEAPAEAQPVRVTYSAPAAPTAPASRDAACDLIVRLMAERTGYAPGELGLDLDVEVDLGIDTVKQITVLRAACAEHGSVLPEHVALRELRTLRRFAEFVATLSSRAGDNGHGAPPVVAVAVVAPEPAVAPAPALRSDAPPLAEVQQFLVEQLVEKTGYPPDLLEPDLDLEAELGIDTVKQVDVLVRAFRRYQAAPDKTLRVRQYNTIGKMAALVQARAGSAVGMDLAALREQAAAALAP